LRSLAGRAPSCETPRRWPAAFYVGAPYVGYPLIRWIFRVSRQVLFLSLPVVHPHNFVPALGPPHHTKTTNPNHPTLANVPPHGQLPQFYAFLPPLLVFLYAMDLPSFPGHEAILCKFPPFTPDNRSLLQGNTLFSRGRVFFGPVAPFGPISPRDSPLPPRPAGNRVLRPCAATSIPSPAPPTLPPHASLITLPNLRYLAGFQAPPPWPPLTELGTRVCTATVIQPNFFGLVALFLTRFLKESPFPVYLQGLVAV